ncbi:SDR family NAD(P)-dependent oxidoreductase [Brevundimonas aurifodinae]|uniref:SDR family oxidoreductase n=1 Tax=Brevundimonas aurifodinae TaxID=1508312 RepID=A0ABV1NNE2_9CAUL
MKPSSVLSLGGIGWKKLGERMPAPSSSTDGSHARYFDLANIPVLISGGGSGIGAEIVRRFAQQGARVGFLEVNAEAAASLASSIEGVVAYEVVDLRDIGAARAAVSRLAGKLGAFRVLVNNAGDDARHAWKDITPEQWDDRFAVNLRHQFFLAQAVASGMAQAGGGSIINLGSISWMFGAVGVIAYTTAKAAVGGLTKSLARELGRDSIRVNAIAPGWVLTEKQVSRAQATDPSKFAAYLERQCLKEHLDAGDIASMALWLASGESRRCTGQTFIVDGGVI